MRRALGSWGSDGVLYPLAYCAGVRRMRSLPAAPQVGWATLFPVPPIGSTAVAGSTVLADNRTRCSKTSALSSANFFDVRRAARLGTNLRLRFIVVSPFENGPIWLRSKQNLRAAKVRRKRRKARTVVAAVDNDARRRRFKMARGIVPAPKGLRRGAESKDSTGIQASPNWNASTRNLRTKVAQWGGPRAEEAPCARPIETTSETRRARLGGSQLADEQGICAADVRFAPDVSAGVRGARRQLHRFRFKSAAERRRGASLERFTNAIPLRPAPCGSIAMRPRCGRPQFRRARRRTVVPRIAAQFAGP